MAELGLQKLSPYWEEGRQHVLGLFERATNQNVPRSFPGTMPVTLSRRHIGMIKQNDYVLLEKSDGVRYLLFTTSKGAYLVDRRFEFYPIPNSQVNKPPEFMEPQTNTLLDGELVYNFVTETYEYLIYDAISIQDDISVAGMEYRQRMTLAENWVAAPRVYSVTATGALRIRIKDYYEVAEIKQLFDHIKKDEHGKYVYINYDRRDGVVCNENDGCIFTPAKLSYPIKTCNALLKWKPPHLNSVDFLLRLEKIMDLKGGRLVPIGIKSSIFYRDGRSNAVLREVRFPRDQRRLFQNNFDKFNNSIVELTYDRLAGEWRYIRQRDDKIQPNYAGTVIDTLESISENMDREELVKSIMEGGIRVNHQIAKKRKIERENVVFRNDLFDLTNLDYVQAIPMSLVAPPMLPPEPHRPPRRVEYAAPATEEPKTEQEAPAASNPYAVEV